MNIFTEATVMTALVTLVVLALVTVVMVRKYGQQEKAQIRQRLVEKAHKYDIGATESLTNTELAEQVHVAKQQAKSDKMKTA